MKQRILFEATPMVDTQKTGIGYYVDYLIRSLADTNELELEGYYFDFLGRNHKQAPAIPHTKFHKISLIPGKLLSVTRRFRWQPPLEVFSRSPSDVTLFTNYVSLPTLRNTKVALVVYDLSYLDHPEFIQEKNLAFLNAFCSDSIQKADLIITISEFTKQRIVGRFPNITANVVVTPIPPVPLEKYPPDDTILAKHDLKPHQYILYLGTIEPRKNIEKLIKGYSLLPNDIRNTYPLVLAGGKGWKDASIRATIEAYRTRGCTIVTTGYITDETKDSLYRNASCYTLPSHYEGFGMPVLEAMQHSVPVAVSDIPVFHEVAGKAAAYFDQNNPSAIAETISRILTDIPYRNSLIAAQQSELNKYSWSTNAQVVTTAFKGLTKR